MVWAAVIVRKKEHEEVACDSPGTAMLLDGFAFQSFVLSPGRSKMNAFGRIKSQHQQGLTEVVTLHATFSFAI